MKSWSSQIVMERVRGRTGGTDGREMECYQTSAGGEVQRREYHERIIGHAQRGEIDMCVRQMCIP